MCVRSLIPVLLVVLSLLARQATAQAAIGVFEEGCSNGAAASVDLTGSGSAVLFPIGCNQLGATGNSAQVSCTGEVMVFDFNAGTTNCATGTTTQTTFGNTCESLDITGAGAQFVSGRCTGLAGYITVSECSGSGGTFTKGAGVTYVMDLCLSSSTKFVLTSTTTVEEQTCAGVTQTTFTLNSCDSSEVMEAFTASFAPTIAPSTLAPTTDSPTMPPTTLAPTTMAPTMPPTTLAPTTLEPTTQAPTMPPTTLMPTTMAPTMPPTTLEPTTLAPTLAPTTLTPTKMPTLEPTTLAPTLAPTTLTPTKMPTMAPTKMPTMAPTKMPTLAPTEAPTFAPSVVGANTTAPTSDASSSASVGKMLIPAVMLVAAYMA